jgi:general secretion pathway protein L
MEKGRAPAELDALLGTAREIVAAWRHELSALGEHLFGKALRDDVGELALVYGSETIRLMLHRNGCERELGQIARDQDGFVPRLREILAISPPAYRDMTLILPQAEVLRPRVRLPDARRRTLRQALTYELERLIPIPVSAVYFDFRIVGRDPTSKTADIELRVIRREAIDGAIAVCQAAGLAVSAIGFEGEPIAADTKLFPVDRKAHLVRLWRRWNVPSLVSLTFALLLAVLFAVYLHGSAELDTLTEQVSSEGVRAARVERLETRVTELTAQLSFLERQRRAPMLIGVLSDVAKTLPDGTWITEFDMTGDKVRLGGYSHAASDLIGLFDRSGKFSNAQFTAPVTQGPSQGLERFDMTVELAKRAR